MKRATMQITELSQVESIITKLREKLFAIKIPHEAFLDVQLALMEIIGNAFLHGTIGLENPQVEVEWQINNNSITLKVTDNGSGFDYKYAGTIYDDDILEEKGRGLFLVFNVLDEVRFNDKGNEIYCLKRW